MTKVTTTSSRKMDHIRINLEEDVGSGISTGLEKLRLPHRALPEISLAEVDTSIRLFSKHLNLPVLISSMTGGTDEAAKINRNLAEAAQAKKIAMGVGSQRIAIEKPETINSFGVRQFAPDILLFANIGAVQLNYGYSWEQCQQAVDDIEADALILHLNPLQEAIQPEGNTNFAALAPKITDVVRHISVPVIAKEVGWGFSKADVQVLAECGISAIDAAGAGGTSWSQVEMYRTDDPDQRELAREFINWGIPTAEAIRNVRHYSNLPVIASGGLKTGLDMSKCLALGASLCGYAGIFLKAATISAEEVIRVINKLERVLKISMFATGSRDIIELQHIDLIED